MTAEILEAFELSVSAEISPHPVMLNLTWADMRRALWRAVNSVFRIMTHLQCFHGCRKAIVSPEMTSWQQRLEILFVCVCLFSPSGTLGLLHYPLLSFHFKFTANGKKTYCKSMNPYLFIIYLYARGRAVTSVLAVKPWTTIILVSRLTLPAESQVTSVPLCKPFLSSANSMCSDVHLKLK